MTAHSTHMQLDKNAHVKGQVLMVCTSHNTLADGKTPTGLWLSELAEPYFELREAGYDVTLCSPAGGEVPVDDASLQGDFKTPEAARFLETDETKQLLAHTAKLADIKDPAYYDCVFVPGGHGPVFDLAASELLAEVLGKAAAAGKLIAAVCHGPAGLVLAKGPDGKPLVSGKRVTGFSNTEEEAVGKTKMVPWLLEDKLKELGAAFERADDWAEHVVTDGSLITGQNPGSAKKVGQEMVRLLDARCAKDAVHAGGVTVTAGEAGLA